MDSFVVSQPLAPATMPPQPGMPPPQGMPGSGGGLDLQTLLDSVVMPKPKYESGYKPPKKPKSESLWGESTTLRGRYQPLLNRWYTDRLWLRMHLVDLFQEDLVKRNEGGLVEEFQSTAMVSDWNTMCAFGSGLPFNPKHRVYDQNRAIDARKLCDAVRFIREKSERRHARAYGTSLSMDEWRILTSFGRIVAKGTINYDDTECPPRIDLLDPSTVFFRTDGQKLTHAYHRYKTTYRELVGTFGPAKSGDMRKIQADHGEDWLDCECEVLDYYDSWYRAVVTEDCVWLPVTAHEYGRVPFVRQMGPFGESPLLNPQMRDPLFKNSREEIIFGGESGLQDTYQYQGLSYIHYARRSHQQFERIMARVIMSFMKATKPAIIHEHDSLNSDDAIVIDTDSDQVTTIPVGDKVGPLAAGSSPLDTNTALTAISEEQKRTLLPPIFGGYSDASNVSGSAANVMTDAGQDKAMPWVASMETFHQQCYEMALMLERNFGDQVGRSSIDSTPQPFTVPLMSPRQGENPVVEITRDLIDRVGEMITISMRSPRDNEKLSIANFYAIAVDKGWATNRQAAEALGDTDYERTRQEWMEDDAMMKALNHPKFVEGLSIPFAMMEGAKESEGDPTMQMFYRSAMKWWSENVMMPNQMMQQQQIMQAQQPQQPMGQPGMLPAGPGQAPPSQTGVQTGPGGGPGISFQDLGAGPGSVNGQQGGPRGPIGAGQDGSPPPGSGA